MDDVVVMLRTMVYRLWYQYMLGRCEFGRGVRIEGALRCHGPGKIIIGPQTVIARDFWLDRPVIIATHSRDARVRIGHGVLMRGTAIGCFRHVVIEDGVWIEDAHIIDSDFHAIEPEARLQAATPDVSPVLLKRNSYVGLAALLMKGVELGESSSVSAGCCLRMKRIPKASAVRGFPAKAYQVQDPSLGVKIR